MLTLTSFQKHAEDTRSDSVLSVSRSTLGHNLLDKVMLLFQTVSTVALNVSEFLLHGRRKKITSD